MSTNNITQQQVAEPALGRPSVANERREQIVGAFIELVAERSSAAVTITETAERAGIHRSAVRHFVGNRAALVAAAVDEICKRHDESRERQIGSEPDLDAIVDHYFSRDYVWDHAQLDDVFGLLLVSASGDKAIASSIADDYRGAMAELLEHLGRDDPSARAAAYQVICLAEHNVVLQRMGFDPELSEATRALARQIIDRVRTS
ncbi:MAG: TetR/AcrR family transcriptional regulator [Actinomycetota bacterium]